MPNSLALSGTQSASGTCRGMSVLTRLCQQLVGGGAGFVGDGGAGQQAGDLLAPLLLVERGDGGDGVVAEGLLGDAPMLVGHRRDLWGVGDDQHLEMLGEALQALA